MRLFLKHYGGITTDEPAASMTTPAAVVEQSPVSVSPANDRDLTKIVCDEESLAQFAGL
jgi:hypothetical protein